MPASKRMQISTLSTPAQSGAARQADIRAFSRIGKAGVADAVVEVKQSKIKSTILAKDTALPLQGNEWSPRKRKRAENENPEPDEEEQCKAGQPERKRSKHDDSLFDQSIGAATKTRSILPQLPTPETTPTKPNQRPVTLQTPLKKPLTPTSVLQTPPKTPQENDDEHDVNGNSANLPNEILDLIQLHYAFLRALSLHYAHNGTTAPINLLDFMPSVSKIWGRRTVTVLDMRRDMGIMQAAQTSKVMEGDGQKHLNLNLYDYGRGRLCIERTNVSQQRLVIARHIEEETLNDIFQDEMEQSWHRWIQDHSLSNFPQNNILKFLDQLPLIPIKQHPSLAKVAPLFTEGLRRLSSIRSLASASSQHVALTSNEATLRRKNSTGGIQSRNQSLVDRLKAKATLQSTLPPAPTKEELDRKAALHRLPAITSMLIHLSCASTTSGVGTSTRQTFSMQSLVQQIQDSSRSPLSKDEVEQCLRLLAEDIAQGWVKVVRTGRSVLGVVIDGAARPADKELERRRTMELLK